MKNKKIYLIFIAILLCSTTFAQHPQINRTMNWFFGLHWVGTNFNSDEVEFLENLGWFALEACSSISDKEGNLLFYTNGEFVFNSTHWLMAGIDLFDDNTWLNGWTHSAMQGTLILPQPGNDSLYYIFTSDSFESFDEGHLHRGLCYSMVNMNKDNGYGKIVELNTPLLDSVGESVIATIHNNGTDYWLISSNPTGKLYSWLIDETGISGPINEFQSTNINCPGAWGKKNIQFLKFSPRGNLIFKGSLCWSNEGYASHSLMGFNNITGIFEFEGGTKFQNPEIILETFQDTTIVLWTRASFSPSGNYLYTIKQMSLHPHWLPSVIERYKIDEPIDEDNIINSKELFYTSDNGVFYMFQNTPHGNMFVSGSRGSSTTQSGNKIHVIHNPNSEDYAYLEENVYDLSEIYDAPYSPVGPYPSTSFCFNNTVEAWLYNDNEITTYKSAIAKQNRIIYFIRTQVMVLLC